MNNDLTAQEAALYLGQQVISKIEPASPIFSGKGTIIGVKQKEYGLHVQTKTGKEKWKLGIALLVLRPITDMSEEESIHLGFKSPRWANFHFGNGNNALIKPDHFLYLISRGFDLFQLIERGKALNKTYCY